MTKALDRRWALKKAESELDRAIHELASVNISQRELQGTGDDLSKEVEKLSQRVISANELSSGLKKFLDAISKAIAGEVNLGSCLALFVQDKIEPSDVHHFLGLQSAVLASYNRILTQDMQTYHAD